MSNNVAAIFEQGLLALDDDDLDRARAALDEARDAGVGTDDPSYLHLAAMIAWVEGDIDEATSMLEQAVEAGPEDLSIYLTAGDLLAEVEEFDAAEAALRKLLAHEHANIEILAEARMMLAEIRLEHSDPDPEEALELLDQVDESLRDEAAYVSLRAAALLQMDRFDEGTALLEQALARDNDTELRYQLGLACRAHGDEARAVEALLFVREDDLVASGCDPSAPVPSEEVEDLRRRFEDVIDTLPDPVLNRVASAPIHVQRWISEDHVRQGIDPRSAIAFEGTPAPEEGGEAELRGIIVFRDVLIQQIDDDDEIADLLAIGILDEVARLFKIEDLELGL
jgi:tetratricopeptide (TPR) repeat protein